MSENLIKAQDVFLEKINQLCNKFGLNNIMAQIYAILYLSDKPLSLNDMVERLKISKGSASINIRALERYGVVRQVWIKGSRRDFYEAETDVGKVMMDIIKSMAQSRLGEVDDMINSSAHALDSVNSNGHEDDESIRIFKERLAKLKDLHTKAQGLFNLLNSGLFNGALSNGGAANEKEPNHAAAVQ